MSLYLYESLASCSAPALCLWLSWRASGGKEDPHRLHERKGIASRRPFAAHGPLVWVHGASVGEATAALTLIEALAAQKSDVHFLLTTGTVAAAKALTPRLPPLRAVHAYAPLDVPQWVERFLETWRPQAAIFLESEIWPNTLAALKTRKIPTFLMSARLSPKSFSRWQRFAPHMAKHTLDNFEAIFAQDAPSQERFWALGALHVQIGGNLKYAAPSLPADSVDLETLTHAIGDRPVWLYASTHAAEEALAARVHKALAAKIPGLLTLIAPRHPERRGVIAQALDPIGLPYRFRGDKKDVPESQDALYIADTLGELGLFYRLAPVAMIGRSLSQDGGGGHNPLEAAQLGAFPLHGPHVHNLAAIYSAMDAVGAAQVVEDEAALIRTLTHFLCHYKALNTARAGAKAFAESTALNVQSALKTVLDVL